MQRIASAITAHPVRIGGVVVVGMLTVVPLALVVYQSLLDAPFFMNAHFSFKAYAYVLSDPEFHKALRNSLLIAFGLVAIALPLGAALAFLITRTDLPGRGWMEPFLLIPMFISSIVFAFGYVVSVGPVGFVSLLFKETFGFIPWTLYSMSSIVLIAGLTHVPQVYLYVSAALRNLNPDVEEAARVAGAGVWRTAFTVSIPLVLPALVFSGLLMFLVGVELFGLVLVLGSTGSETVLTSYLFRIVNLLGRPSYELMAVVAFVTILLTAPPVLLQRFLLKSTAHYATISGRGAAVRPIPLGPWRWIALAFVAAWFFFTVLLPLGGIFLRSFVSAWGIGVSIPDVLTLDNYRNLFSNRGLSRAIMNTLLLSVVGGACAIVVYTGFALIPHRWKGKGVAILDFLVVIPRALPGLLAGLLFLWIFLFIPGLAPIRGSLVSIWIAYLVVWLAYGVRLISTSLYQIGPELEEAARVAGASQVQAYWNVTLPLLRFGLVASWILIFIAFCREYSTGYYLMGPNTQVIGSLLIALFVGSEIRTIAALAVVNVVMIGIGVILAMRLGGRLHA